MPARGRKNSYLNTRFFSFKAFLNIIRELRGIPKPFHMFSGLQNRFSNSQQNHSWKIAIT